MRIIGLDIHCAFAEVVAWQEGKLKRITKQGRRLARGMLVEAAWAAARASGPLQAFFLRVSSRRG
jgi:Transposase IS116/IS110/IS902 family